MGLFSRSCEYGIKACIHIGKASAKNELVKLKEVASAIGSPEAFTAKILQQLARSGMISSIKGHTGGYFIAKENLDKLMIADVVIAIDGPDLLKGCALGLENCNDEKPCPVHDQYKAVRNGLVSMLNTTSIIDLVKGLKSAHVVLKQ